MTSKNKDNELIETEDFEMISSTEASLFLTEETEQEGFLPDADLNPAETTDEGLAEASLAGTELDGFEAISIEELEFVEDEQIESIIESILFASDRPVSLASIQLVFKGTNVKKEKIRSSIEALAVEYAGGRRGVSLEEVTGGYQIRTKIDNMNFLKRTIKTRAFKLSGPALETLSIVAYKQPVIKMELDQIRGVESGHLLRALMEKGLVNFEGKAEHLPGKPMQYGTTRRFLEIFGLRNIKELPTLSQIDELLPEGIGEEVEEKSTLAMVTESMSTTIETSSYSQGEHELGLIEEQLTSISVSSEFFEQEKIRAKMKKDNDKAQDIRDALAVGEEVAKRDLNWLKRFEEALLAPTVIAEAATDALKSISETLNSESEVSGLRFEDDDVHIEDELPFVKEADDGLT